MRAPAPVRSGDVLGNDPAEINEQLRTEVEELQEQVLELRDSKSQDERATRAVEWLARLAEENPDPALRVSKYGAILYRNPASLGLCRLWNPRDELAVPAAVRKLVSAAYAGTQVVRDELTFGKRTYLITVAPAPPPADYVNIFARDITGRKKAEEALHELNATLEAKVARRTESLAHRTRQLQKLTLELAQTEERERKRMAEILHDDLQQILAAAKFHLSIMRNRVKSDGSLQALGSEIDELLKEAIEKSRQLSHELSPVVLHHSDFTETLRWLADQVRARQGLVVHVHADGPGSLQSETVKSFLYRTAQELLFNVAKHARVPEAGIRFRRHGHYACLLVSDRGRGFDPQELREAAGYGLLSIRERIELLGGRMEIRSAKGKGSRIFVMVPESETRPTASSEQSVAAIRGPDRQPVPPTDEKEDAAAHLRSMQPFAALQDESCTPSILPS